MTELNTRRQKNLADSGVGRINSVKMTIPPKAFYRVYPILMKISMILFKEIEKEILEITQKYKRP